MTLIDISPLVDESIEVWPGDTPYAHRRTLDIANGDNLTLSEIRTTLHVGAHADAPNHCLERGGDIASRSLDAYVGRCAVVHVERVGGRRIVPEDIAGKRIGAPRVLFRTNTFRDARHWNNNFASFSPELVEHLHALGVILAGIDTPSVDPFESKELEAHKALARHGIANLEGLVLDAVAEGEYELIALPLRLRRADASPVRAVLRTL